MNVLWHFCTVCINTSRPRQNGRHFADVIFKCISLNENVWTSIIMSLNFAPKGPFNNIPSSVPIMAWHQPGEKPLSEPIMVSLLTHICVIRPQSFYIIATLSNYYWVVRRFSYRLNHPSNRKWYFTLNLCTRLYMHPTEEWSTKTCVPNQGKNTATFENVRSEWESSMWCYILTFTVHTFTFRITVLHLDGTCGGNHSSWTTETRHWNMLNTMAATDLAMRGTRISQAIVLS